MFPKVAAEPRAARGPDAIDIIDGGGAAPDVGVVVKHPAVGMIQVAGRASAADGQVLNHAKKREAAFAEICDLGGPVIHFNVDVCGVFAFPRGIEKLVPDALEIRRLGARAAAGNEHISAILEKESGQCRVTFKS